MRNNGFTVVEIMATILIVAVLGIVAVVSYDNYRVRSKVAGMLQEASAAQLAVTNDYFSQGSTLASIDYAANSQPFTTSHADYITSIAIVDGVITITGNSSKLNGNAIVLTITPTLSNNEITWTCSSSSSFYSLVPAECKN